MNQYEVLSKLGEGSFASVYKVKRKQDSKEYALKRIKIQCLAEKQIANCLNEVRILASIDSPYVVGYMDSFYDTLSTSFCIVTEYLQGGDLSHYIKKYKSANKSIKQNKIWTVAIQCLKGLKSLHKLNIFHRDIKSANILMNKEHNFFKLADMNVSKISDNGMAQTQTGTPYFASPEVWQQNPYTSKCDVWSLGCLLYQMATFKPPFLGNDLRGLKKNIMKGQYKPLSNCYSKQLNNFISLCLKVNANDRLSAEQLLNHEIIQQATFWKLDTGVQNQQQYEKNTSMKIIEKIQIPKRKDFHLIGDKLPKSKFASEQKRNSKLNESKQNNININNSSLLSSKMTRKIQLPPMIKKNQSQTQRNKINSIKFLQQRVVNLCQETKKNNKNVR